MKVLLLISMVVAGAIAQDFAPIPYSFNYQADSEDGGSSGHQQQGDGSGRVTGSYTVTNLEGHTRVVEYIADENGFRATVRTNEPGTANINPADVVMESSADAGAVSYSLGGGAVAPTVVRQPAVTAAQGGRGGSRYVLVPVTDPRARGYY